MNRSSKVNLLSLAAIIVACSGVSLYASSRYMIGYDDQTHRCLDEKFFVIDKWKKPTIQSLERYDLVAVAMREDQRPEHALWSEGQVMVKRLLASQVGDKMKVESDGVIFENSSEKWEWGTALEASEMLRLDADDLERTITLQNGEFFLMGDKPFSYDSRYYGPANENQIIGRVVWAF